MAAGGSVAEESAGAETAEAETVVVEMAACLVENLVVAKWVEAGGD